MSDGSEPRVDREGIHIDPEVAARVDIDEELDANLVGAYRFSEPGRRRISGWVLLASGAIAALSIQNGWWLGLGFAGLAAWQFLSAWPLAVGEGEALSQAAAAVDFPVGHASATVRVRGWRSRPTWSVVLYSASDPPDERALVLIDSVEGRVVGRPYQESVDPV
jgi:hypothetical protein